MKRKMLLNLGMCCILLLGVVGNASAALVSVKWHGTADSNWANPANWSDDIDKTDTFRVPVAGDRAMVNNTYVDGTSNTPVISTNETMSELWWTAFSEVTTSRRTADITVANGGTLNILGDPAAASSMILGRGYVDSTLTIQTGGSVVNAKQILVGYETSGTGIIVIEDGATYSGTNMIVGARFATLPAPFDTPQPLGQIYQQGGTVTLTGGTGLQVHRNKNPNNVYDITGGVLMMADTTGAKETLMNSYIADGWMTNSSGEGLVVDWNISNPGFTTVQLVPEPATLMLLGIGGLSFLRRKRA